MFKSIAEKVQRYRIAVIALWFSLGIGGATYTISYCKINTDTQDLLSEKLDWRVEYDKLKSAFPQLSDNLAVVIESRIPESAQKFAENLAIEISNMPEHFSYVFYPDSNTFFQRNYFLYLDEKELENQFNKLSESQAFIGLLADSPSYETFLDVLLKSLPEASSDHSIFLRKFHTAASDTIRANLKGDTLSLSWINLMKNDLADMTRVVVLTKPTLDYQEMLPAKESIAKLDAIIEDLKKTNREAVSVSVTGSAALNHDELLSVTQGASTVGLAAIVFVTIILYLGLKSSYLIIASLLSLVIGLACTAGFATLAIGTLNMISIAFAVLYVGLAIDFAIHLCLRYQEHCSNLKKDSAVKLTIKELGRSISLCAFTTSIGFLAFIPTDYKGVAELGLISGVGMLLSLVISLTLLPAILLSLPKPRLARPRKTEFLNSLDSGRNDKKILFFFGVIMLFSVGQIQDVSFDNDPINLNDQNASSVKALKRLAKENENPLAHLTITRESMEEIEDLQRIMSSNPAVGKTISLLDLIPFQQEAKADLVQELDFILGGSIEVEEAETPSPTKVIEKIDEIIAKIQSIESTSSLTTIRLRDTLVQLKKTINLADKNKAHDLVESIEKDTFNYFPRLTELLSLAMSAEPFEIDEIPFEIKNFWQNKGLFRLEIHPFSVSEDKNDTKYFVESVKSQVNTGITGVPIINLEASDSVISAFIQALATAITIIFLIVLVMTRKISASFLIVSPVCLACLFASSLLVLFGLSVNFANIIALPLLLGLGVDSSIHIYYRFSTSNGEFAFLRSSTARAVVFSSLTTAASFGSLAVSPHAGTASLGLLLSLGLICILISSLVLLPALIRKSA